MLADNITKMIGEAMKAYDEVRLMTLRMLSSALNYGFIEKQHKLNEEEEIVVVKKEAKMRKDAIEALRQAQGKPTSSGNNMDERIKKEEAELKILQEFLPEEMTEAELNQLINESISQTGASKINDMGKVIGLVMAKSKGRADGSKVAQLAKAKLI